MPRNTSTSMTSTEDSWDDTESAEAGNDDSYNWDEVDEFSNEFEVAPRGDYDYEITDCDFSYAKSSGNPMLTIEFTFYNPATERKFKVWHNATFHEEQRPRFKHFIKSLGQEMPNGWNPIRDHRDLVGKRGRAKVGIDKGSAEYPKPKNKIVDILPRTEGQLFTNDDL